MTAGIAGPHVTVAPSGFAGTVSITRPNNTTGYSANSVINGAVQFTNMGPIDGGEVMLTSARLQINRNAVISGETSYILYLYSVTPPSAYTDGNTWDLASGDYASFLCTIPLGTPVDLGSTLNVESDIINKQITLPQGASLFGYLVSVGAYTPTALGVYVVIIHTVGL